MSEEKNREPLISAKPDKESFVADKEKLVSLAARASLFGEVLRDIVHGNQIPQQELVRLFRFHAERLSNSEFSDEAYLYGYDEDRAKEIMNTQLNSLSWLLDLDVMEDK